MHLALLLATTIAAIVWPYPLVLAGVILAGSLIGIHARKKWSLRWYLFLVWMLCLPAALFYKLQQEPNTEPPDPDLGGLLTLTQPERYFSFERLGKIIGVLQSRNPRFGNRDAIGLLDEVDLPGFTSISVLNLNFEPMVWKGDFFYDNYRQLRPAQPELVMKDGRLFLVHLVPLPSSRQIHGFLAIEIAFLSQNYPERANTWLGQTHPLFNQYQPVVVQPDVSEFLYRQAQWLEVDAPPFDIAFVHQAERRPYLDLLALAWSLSLLSGMFLLLRQLGSVRAWPWFLGFLALLALPGVQKLDALTGFASYIFGNQLAGNLFSSPFHLFMSIGLAFLLFQCLKGFLPLGRAFMGWLLLIAVLTAFLVGPQLLQKYNVHSLTHPLEAFSSPGAFLSHISFLMSFAYVTLIFEHTVSLPLSRKLAAIAVGLAVTLPFEPILSFTVVSLGLIWIIKDSPSSFTLKAGLAVLAFYPAMVLREHRGEIAFIQNEILDEITLQVERNHFRLGRLIQRLPELQTQIESAPHAQLMEMFAKHSGLLQDEIDFALRLTGPNGNVISEIDQHISLDRIPYEFGPDGRIESFQESPSGPFWLVFRKTLETEQGHYGFVAVLSNDYQNLSLVRRLRTVSQAQEPHRETEGSPYFAYILDVFDEQGTALYTQGTSPSLGQNELQRLEKEPYFWYVEGRNTFFFIKDRSFIFRITHLATPIRMIFVRFLALFLALVLLLKGIRLLQRPGRGLIQRWKRSFSMKLAGFMFLSSVLPTSMLGFFLISSIQRNQAREEASLAQSKILAARNLFGNPEPLEDLANRNRHSPRDLPIQKTSRILGEDLSLFLTGSMLKTNQPEIFRYGVLNRRLPFPLARELYMDKASYRLQKKPLSGGGSLLVAYSPINLGPNREGVLAMTMIPFNQRQKMRWQEQLEFSVTLLFGLLFVMAELTRFFARSYLKPVSAITKAAVRMAKGLSNPPISIKRQDELDRMVKAFNTMRERIVQSQSELRQQLSVLDETLKSMSSGLLGFDKEGNVILENEKARNILQLETLPHDLRELTRREPGLAPLNKLFGSGEGGEFSFHLNSQEAERVLLGVLRMVPTRKARDLYSILVVEDITDAVAASRFKAWSEMARRVAHEIKNPLTPIQLEIDHLLNLHKDGHPQFGEALEDGAHQITEQVKHLRRIATEFSDYARPLDLEPRETDLTRLLQDILSPYEKTLPKIRIRKNLGGRVVAMVDDRLLRRALHNLVVNALQAMEEEGELCVDLATEVDSIVILIADTGPGIPEEEQSKIFEAYFSTKDHGTGLGLVIAKRYIGIHGGTIAIDPDYREGTRFRIVLPWLKPAGAEISNQSD